jgi:hypothetical protein
VGTERGGELISDFGFRISDFPLNLSLSIDARVFRMSETTHEGDAVCHIV